MLLIPQRLFNQAGVTTIFRVAGNNSILEKKLVKDTGRREGYLSCHVVSIVLQGRQRIETYEEQQYTIQAGEAILLPRGLYHISDFKTGKGPFRSLLFYFDDQLVADFLSKQTEIPVRSGDEVEAVFIPEAAKLTHFAEALLKVYGQANTRHPELLRLKIHELLYACLASTQSQKVTALLQRISLPKKRGIKAFMQRNYHKQLKVEDYAYLTGRSISSFRRDFKAHFQQTPQQWLKEKRMEAAVALISNSQPSVSQLAFSVGYDNVSYFIREFEGHTGLTPKQYMLRKSTS